MSYRRPKGPFDRLFTGILDKFQKNEKRIYLYAGIFLLFIIILAGLDLINLKKIFSFVIFVIIGAVFKYLITHYRLWLEFTPVPFFCVIIAQTMGVFWVIPYIFIADIVTMFMAGQGPTGGSVPYWLWMLVFSVISLGVPLNTFGKIFLPVLYFIASLLIDHFVRGGLHAWRWASHIASLVINAYFFLKLAEFFVGMVV